MADSLMGPATGLVNSKLALADAGAENVLSGKKFYAGDKVIKTGTMPNNGAWSSTIDPGQTVQVPGGYHTGGGTVRAGSVSGLLKRTTIVKTCNPGVNNFTFTGGTLVGLSRFPRCRSKQHAVRLGQWKHIWGAACSRR